MTSEKSTKLRIPCTRQPHLDACDLVQAAVARAVAAETNWNGYSNGRGWKRKVGAVTAALALVATIFTLINGFPFALKSSVEAVKIDVSAMKADNQRELTEIKTMLQSFRNEIRSDIAAIQAALLGQRR